MFTPLFHRNKWKCLSYFPCGWDEDNPYSSKNCQNKENIVLSCARFGTYQKNTEMLVEAFCNLKRNKKLEGWKLNRILVQCCLANIGNEKKSFMEVYLSLYTDKTEYDAKKYWYVFRRHIWDKIREKQKRT